MKGILPAILCLVLGLAAAAAASAPDPLLDTSRRLAADLTVKALDTSTDQFTPDIQSSLPKDRLDEIFDRLIAQYGRVGKVGTPWFEDRVNAYRRYRVPIVFEKGTVDLRLVYDTENRVAGLFFVAHSEPPPTQEAPVPEIEVTVGPSDDGLPGTLTLPKGKGPFPAVLLVQGSGPSDRDETIGPNKPFRDIAWGLAERGIASLRYDKRSYVAPKELAAAGDSLTVRQEVIDDARAGLDLLRKDPRIDSKAVYVAGHSLGGHLAPRIAASKPHPAGVIILAGSTLPIPEKMLEQERYIFSLDGGISTKDQAILDTLAAQVSLIRDGLTGKKTVTGFHLGAPIGYYRDLEAHDPPRILHDLGLPCLILQGGRDYQVTRDDFARWQAAVGGEKQACLRVFEGLDHLLREGTGPSSPADYETGAPVAPALIDCMANWILRRECCSK